MKSFLTILPVLLIVFPVDFGFSQQKIDWNGYLQYRFSSNYTDQTMFSVRRAKFWVFGNLPIESGQSWNYKVQAIFHQQVKYEFWLQDVFVNFKMNGFEITAGQFVPDFNLQRKQPDYAIPIVERTAVVNSLVPAAETMARDIGIELKLSDNKIGSVSLGLFNGNGANNTTSKEKNFLIVHRGVVSLLNNSDSKFDIGYNISYRNAKDMQFSKIFNGNYVFSGSDFRFDVEGKLNIGDFELQSEYIEAHLGAQKACGYYALADYEVTSKQAVALSIEQLYDLNPSTVDDPWYIVSYTYFIKGDEIKISIDNRFQFTSSNTNTQTTIQVQYFFNQK